MKIQEIIKEEVFEQDPNKESVIKHFIKYVAKKLGIDIPVSITFSYDTEEARREHHTGAYNWKENKMWVYVGDRNLIDILRTVCHELVHVKQDQEDKITHHDAPGSPNERQADEIAGYLIKLYVRKHHNIID